MGLAEDTHALWLHIQSKDMGRPKGLVYDFCMCVYVVARGTPSHARRPEVRQKVLVEKQMNRTLR